MKGKLPSFGILFLSSKKKFFNPFFTGNFDFLTLLNIKLMENRNLFHQSKKYIYTQFSIFLKTTCLRCCIMARLWCIGTMRVVPRGRRWCLHASIALVAPSCGKSHPGVLWKRRKLAVPLSQSFRWARTRRTRYQRA